VKIAFLPVPMTKPELSEVIVDFYNSKAWFNALNITIISADDGTVSYIVPSTSGETKYNVRYLGCGDEGVALWNCDCPAAQRGENCKHALLVSQIDILFSYPEQ